MRRFEIEDIQDSFNQVVVLVLQEFSNDLIVILQDLVQGVVHCILL